MSQPEKATDLEAKEDKKAKPLKTASASATPKPEPTLLEGLQQAVNEETQKREILSSFITSQLRENIDYGTIRINGRDAKPTLFKPGMEKIFSLFSIISCLEKDEETLSMISTKDVIAYTCRLYRNGQFLSEGRGACTVSEKGRVNDAIKIAEKRARMDACLNLGFSEYFTQDLEDLKDERPVESAAQEVEPSQAEESATHRRPSYDTLEFTVEEKEELQSQAGNPYARLKTDQGPVIAFRNTMNRFEVGSTYLVGGVWEERNGTTAFIVTSAASAVQARQGSAPVKPAATSA